MSEGAATTDRRDWPNGLVVIAGVIGPELTLKLVDEFGGVEKLYIPKLKNGVGLKHPWASVLGDASWRALCKAMGGERINLPRGVYCGLKKRVILDLAENTSLSGRSIARRARCTETYVRMVLRGLDFSGARKGKCPA